MRIGIQNTDWGYVGAVLAGSDDREQAEFFKSFAKECKSWGTKHQVDMQLLAIRDLLTKDEREVISAISYEETI